MKPKKGDLILCEWRDAFSSSGWVDLDDHPKDAVCHSVGWVVRKSKKFLTLAAAKWDGKRNDNVGDPISIPWNMILSMEVLTYGYPDQDQEAQAKR